MENTENTNQDAVAQSRANGANLTDELAAIADNNTLLEIGRKAIEDLLIEWRDDRLSECMRGNGLVIREKDGSDSSIIRFGPETALRVGIKAIAAHMAANGKLTGCANSEGVTEK